MEKILFSVFLQGAFLITFLSYAMEKNPSDQPLHENPTFPEHHQNCPVVF